MTEAERHLIELTYMLTILIGDKKGNIYIYLLDYQFSNIKDKLKD